MLFSFVREYEKKMLTIGVKKRQNNGRKREGGKIIKKMNVLLDLNV